MGLVRVHPRSGAFVQSVDFSSLVDALEETVETALMQEDSNMFHLIEARRLIEIELVGKACARRTPEDMLPLNMALEAMATSPDRVAFIEADEKLHLGIAKIAGNPILTSILRALIVLLRPHRMGLAPTSDRLLRTESRHREIYSAVRDGDAIAARAAMAEHLTEDRDRVLAQMETMPSLLDNHDGNGGKQES
ncbi:MAG: FCD domain-containing protein [Armatimonadota bacterium]|nr:FCD domain-containing protein [Armatimonadota bacterium]